MKIKNTLTTFNIANIKEMSIEELKCILIEFATIPVAGISLFNIVSNLLENPRIDTKDNLKFILILVLSQFVNFMHECKREDLLKNRLHTQLNEYHPEEKELTHKIILKK